METRRLTQFLTQSNVFGDYKESYIGSLNALNPVQPDEETIFGVINTTTYNRLPHLYEELFSWIESVNNISNHNDKPLEIVIIGVGNSAHHAYQSQLFYNRALKNPQTRERLNRLGSPQVVEIVMCLSLLKNRPVNLTLMDRNSDSLKRASNIDQFFLDPYCGENYDEMHDQLKSCFDTVCFLQNGRYKANKEKLKHIKINTYCGDISKIKFPEKCADLVVTTNTLIYINKSLYSKIFECLLHTLKPNGRLLKTDDFGRFEPGCFLVLNFPDAHDCLDRKLYVKLNDNLTVDVCFLSKNENRIVTTSIALDKEDYLYLNICKNETKDSPYPINKLSIINKIIEESCYAKHNYVMLNSVSSRTKKIGYHKIEHIQCANSLLLFSTQLQSYSGCFFVNKNAHQIQEITSVKVPRFGRSYDF